MSIENIIKKMSIKDLMRYIYDFEQNIEITSFFDGGWKVNMGDSLNGYKRPHHCNTMDDVHVALAMIYLELETDLHEQN